MGKKTLHAAKRHREDVANEREAWKQLQETFDIERLVFIDETWTKTNMTPLRGRAEIGKRVIDDVPHGQFEFAQGGWSEEGDGIGGSEIGVSSAIQMNAKTT